MTNPRAHRPPDSFRIVSGALGPVPKCELSIKPMTVFIGRQGTGKSLVAQTLFAFDELPFLMALVGGRRGGSQLTAQALFGEVLDQLRSSSRRFATFANKRVHIQWRRGKGFEGLGKMPDALEYRAYRNNRQIIVGNATTKFLEGLRAKKPTHNAIFFPTERMMMSQLHTAVSQQVLSLPITFTLFTQWLDQFAVVEAAGWSKNRPPTAEGQLVDELNAAALGGAAGRLGDQWKWVMQDAARSKLTFDLDMASSGQRANWSIGFIGRTLFSLRGTRGLGSAALVLHAQRPPIRPKRLLRDLPLPPRACLRRPRSPRSPARRRAPRVYDSQRGGLTTTYNRLKDASETDPAIQSLRTLHEAMDQAVLDAYGWSDVPVPPYCGATPAQLESFEDEVLDRLFDLNERRAHEEALLAQPAAKKPSAKRKP